MKKEKSYVDERKFTKDTEEREGGERKDDRREVGDSPMDNNLHDGEQRSMGNGKRGETKGDTEDERELEEIEKIRKDINDKEGRGQRNDEKDYKVLTTKTQSKYKNMYKARKISLKIITTVLFNREVWLLFCFRILF